MIGSTVRRLIPGAVPFLSRPCRGGSIIQPGRTDAAAGAHRVVIVGGGFGGLQAVRTCAGASRGHAGRPAQLHLFQPLAYQVATARSRRARSPMPLRAIFNASATFACCSARSPTFDLAARAARCGSADGDPRASHPLRHADRRRRLGYSYFGHDEWRPFAPEVKSLESASTWRRILAAFEAAEVERTRSGASAWLTFVVVGAGRPASRWRARSPSSRATRCRATSARSTPRARGSCSWRRPTACCRLPAALSAEPRAARAARGHADVDPRSSDIDEVGSAAGPGGERERSRAHGRVGRGRDGLVASRARGGRCGPRGRPRRPRPVEPDLTLPGHPEVFALGDMVPCAGRTEPIRCPGVAPSRCSRAATPASSCAALGGRAPAPFRYPTRATSPRSGAPAVADIKGSSSAG